MQNVLTPGWSDLLNGLLHLLYPNLCAGCDADLPSQHSCFCMVCQRRLHTTNMHLLAENEFTDRFWGRLPLVSGTALYYFNRKSPIQRALHQLKYRNRPEIGLSIGRRLGSLLAQSPFFAGISAIVPVPLHPQKERLRGYNQSALFAQGIAESTRIPVESNILIRRSATSTQTKKKRMERFDNVSAVFDLHHSGRLAGKHLLLVDDVLTTGATLEACGHVLLTIPGVRLSMATIAIAMRS